VSFLRIIKEIYTSCQGTELGIYPIARSATLYYASLCLNAGIGWAYGFALRFLIVTDAFHTLFRHYIAEILRKGRHGFTIQLIIFAGGIYRCDRAFGLASSAIDAFIVDL
jgi:hypothetical protein